MLENINQCEIKVGLFVLRNCDRAPRYKCQKCNKTICGKHTSNYQDKAWCLECFSQLPEIRKRMEEEDDVWFDDDDSYYDELWYYVAVDDFHHNVKYTPIVASDYEGFNRQGAQDLYADNDLGSFFDS